MKMFLKKILIAVEIIFELRDYNRKVIRFVK